MPSDAPWPPILDGQLQRVQSVTESALAHLTLERLLDELLVRVRDLLHVDTAAILLLDERTNELIATSAKGIEEEVEQGVRIPVGRGFAGTIAARREPVILDSVDHTKVLNPLLLRRGIRSMLGVPLLVAGNVLGVLHVGTLRPHRFTEQDVELLQLVADRAALALHVRRTQQDQLIAETLQRSLLPDRLPRIPGIEISGLYRPAGGGMVGGDWYDAFTLPNGALCLVVGDTVGSGIDAAIAMARLRDAVRALMFVSGAPGAAMSHVNASMQHFDPQVMATAFIGLLEGDGRVRYASAGHLPAILVDRSGATEETAGPTGPALGVGRRSYDEGELVVPKGGSLILYTDGLVERRRRSLSEGIAELRRAASTPWDSLEILCGRVLGQEALAGDLQDDLAVVVLHVSDELPDDALDAVFAADPRELARMRHSLRGWFSRNAIEAQDAADLLLAIGEAASNSIEHAYGPGRGTVRIHARIEDRTVELMVIDEGRWREPRGSDRGRGRTLMQAVMDEVDVHSGEDGTTVRMRKALTTHG